MNWVSIGIGVAAILFGLYTAYARKASPEKLSKLEPMKKAWGEKTGSAIHIAGYTIMPIVLGCIAIYLGVNGRSFF